MAKIRKRFGDGWAGISGSTLKDSETLAQILRDLDTDINAVNTAAGGGPIGATIARLAVPAAFGEGHKGTSLATLLPGKTLRDILVSRRADIVAVNTAGPALAGLQAIPIPSDFGSGGKGVSEATLKPGRSLRDILVEMVRDLAAIDTAAATVVTFTTTVE